MNARQHYKQGDKYLDLGEFKAAITHYAHALELYPDSNKEVRAAIHMNWGIACRKLGELKDAVTHYTLALELLPVSNKVNSAATHSNLGIVCRKLGEFENASTHFARALKLYPDSKKIARATVHCNYGNLYLDLWEFKNAITHFTKALELDPSKNTIISLDVLKTFYKNFYDSYKNLRKYLPPRTRLAVCYEGEVDELLVDKCSAERLLMNKAVILTCCKNTFDFETLQSLPNKSCPCCRKPIADDYFNHPLENLLVQKFIDRYVEEKENLAEEQRLVPKVIADDLLERKDDASSQQVSPNPYKKGGKQEAFPQADVPLEEKEGQPQPASTARSSSSAAPALGGRTHPADERRQREECSRAAFLKRVELKARQAIQPCQDFELQPGAPQPRPNP